jgi:hypothetical protein
MTEDLSREKIKSKRWKDIASYAFLVAFIGFLVWLATSDIDIFVFMSNLVLGFYEKYGLLGIFLGVFIVATFGNSTVIFPVPYSIVLVQVIILIPEFRNFGMIFLLGCAGGAGAGIGEITGYLTGKASGHIVSESEYGKKTIARWQKFVDKGWAMWLVFFFAATPLPDDGFLLFLGMLSYPLMKMLIVCTIGKVVHMLSMGAIAHFIFIKPIFGGALADFLLMLFSLERDPVTGSIIVGQSNPVGSAIVFGVSVLLIVLIMFVDWGKLKRKIKKDPEPILATD